MLYIEADHLADGIYNIKDGEIFKYKAKGGTVRTYKIADIVRCKECKHRTYCYSEVHMTNKRQSVNIHKNIDFCSYGEREGE